MPRKIRSIMAVIVMFGIFAAPVLAGGNTGSGGVTTGDEIGICTFIGPICDALGIVGTSGDDAANQVFAFSSERINQLLSLLFVGIIVIAVFIIVQAGIKYIQSQGDSGEIENAQKSIQSVFIGIAILFVGIIGLILVLAFFGGTGLLGSGETIEDVLNVQDV